jgi:uncharacterized protein DUF5047
MRPVSNAFLNALSGSHRMVARARVMTTFATGVDPDGTVVEITSGDVRFDASAKIRGDLDLLLPNEYWPTTPDDLVTPYGNEVFVERGIVLGGGQREWVSQGYYRIESVEQDDASGGTVRVSGKDRMAGIIDARLEAPIQFPPGTSVNDLLDTLVRDVYPTATIEYDFDPDAVSFPGNHLAEQDRYGFLAEVVKALGKVWFWDYRGVLRVEDAPALSTPAWTVASGERGVLVAMGRERSREGVYNAVVAVGEAPGDEEPVRAVARDTAANSPTRWGGPFGKVPRYYSSSFITSTPQAGNAAASILGRSLGLPYSVNFQTVANPALEPLDPVDITLRGRSERHVIEQLTIPLTADRALTANTKDMTDVSIEVEGV